MNATAPHTYTQIDQLDPILGPTSAAHITSAPQATVLAILAKGHRHHIPAKLMRAWIKSRLASRPEVVKVSQSNAWTALVKASSDWLRSQDERSSSSLAAAVARRGLARCLAETNFEDTKTRKPLGGHKQVVARHTASVLALEAISNAWQGKETVIVSHPWLAVKRGVKRLAAQTHFRMLVEMGWIKVVAGGRAGVPSRIRFARLPAAVGQVVEGDERYAQVGEIAALAETENYVAAVFRSAAHPAWSYSPELSAAHWLALLADAAGVDPVSLGVNKTRVASIRKQLTALLGEPAERDATLLMETLDEHAIELGAFQAYESAEEARRAAAEERRLEVMATREAKRAAADERAQAKKDAKLIKAEAVPVETVPAEPMRETVQDQAARLLPRLYSKAGQLPAPATGTQALKEWLTGATPMLDSCQAPLRMALANALYADTVAAGWPANLAGGFAKSCAGPALQAAA